MRLSNPLLLLVLSASVLVGCGRGQQSVPAGRDELLARTWPCNVVVVLLDAARADRFGYQGYERPTTPNIDALAAQSVVFEQAYAQASGTANSVYTFFTSRYPVFESPPLGARLPKTRGQDQHHLDAMLTALFHYAWNALRGRRNDRKIDGLIDFFQCGIGLLPLHLIPFWVDREYASLET